MSNGLDPDQEPHSIVPDLGPNCLQRISTKGDLTFRMPNSLDPDQDRQNVGPDLGPNCLQR